MSRAFAVSQGLAGSGSPESKSRRLVLEALWMLCPSLAASALLLLCLQLPWEPEPSQIRPEAPAAVVPAGSEGAQAGKNAAAMPTRQKPAWRVAAQE